MEGFIRCLKGLYINCPDTITRDNVNIGLISRGDKDGQTWSLLEEASGYYDIEITQVLLDMGANIHYYELYNPRTPTVLSMLLDNVVNINNIHLDGHVRLINTADSMCGDWYFETLIDYGLKRDYMSPNHPKKHFDYVSQSEARVVASRKALAALIICCKQRTHQGTLVFGAVRDVMFALAREMWAQKGHTEDGCGPRAYDWLSEEGESRIVFLNKK